MSHECKGAAVFCIDFRFQEANQELLKQVYGEEGERYDLIAIAGSTKDLNVAIGQIDVSVRLHRSSKLLLVHHEECGAYGPESTPDRHRRDLIKAQEECKNKFKGVDVEMYYMHLDGTWEKIENR